MNTIKEDKMQLLNISRSQPWREELRKSMKAKDRTEIERHKMLEQNALERSRNQIEVNSGYTKEIALQEAKRCLDCADPTCINGCPVNINIPNFIKNIERGEFLEAAKSLKETNTLPAVCGRVCPQEIQCENLCFYKVKLNKQPVAIGNLERFAADYERLSGNVSVPETKENNGIKVAVIGSGPAGLAAAADLIKWGYDVTVFEALHEIGGVLKYGIPEFRLPNNIVDVEINSLKKMGVKFQLNFIVGKTKTIDELKSEGFMSIFIGSGAGLPNFMNIPGENAVGVFSSNEYLTRVNLMKAGQSEFDTPVFKGRNVAVIGGGNTAMDSVRTALRMGAEKAMIVYRRTFDEMPARLEEIHHAKEEGVIFMTLYNPVAYIADEKGRVKAMRIQKMELTEPDASGRRKPIAIEGSEYEIEVDTVIVSIGVSPNPIIPASMKGLTMTKWSTIEVNQSTMETSISGVFAGGDIVRGGATVILAMGDGRKAAQGMHEYIKNLKK